MERAELIAICAASIFAKTWNGEDTDGDRHECMLRVRAIKHAKAIVNAAQAEVHNEEITANINKPEGI